jgi:PPOX class probable F420-dependent enzyme
MATLTDDAKDLLRRPIYAWATTLYPDGSPHNTIVWVDVDGDEVVFNTAVGRVKEKHLSRDPRVVISLLDPDNPYHVLSVSGSARLDTSDGDAVIDALAKKYLGVDSYPGRTPSEQRITVRFVPERVIYNGS